MRRGLRGLSAALLAAGPLSGLVLGLPPSVLPLVPARLHAQVVPVGPPPSEPAPIQAGVAAPPGSYDRPVDVLHYEIEIAVSDTAEWIQGRTRIDLEMSGALDEPFGLDFSGLAVDRVRVGGQPVEFDHENGRLLVPLPAGQERAAVEVVYRGVPDDGLILGTNVHGDPSAFVDNWPNRARFWFPSVDHPSDKATHSITVHAPGTWKVVANGRPVEPPPRTESGTFGPAASSPRRTWRWENEVPVSTYNMVFGGAEMTVSPVGLAACGRAPASPRPDGCVEVTTWLFPRSVEPGGPSFARADEMVNHFTELIGPFPYQKLANVQSSTRFGGMENASAIFYSEAAIAAGRNIEGTVSHEVAHQWFGDSVTETDWHHLWLSEGFATYFGAQFFEAVDGRDDFRVRMEENRSRYLASEVVGRPIVDPEEDDLFDLLNANHYQKGAWVLHMLRGILGDETFFEGIREYYRRFTHSTALTDDFRKVMEETSGRELDWFFRQWVFEPGHPVLAHRWEWDEDNGEGVVRIRQEQDTAWPTFRIPLTLEIRYDGGSVRREVQLRERSEEFRFDLPSSPTGVVLDPDGWVLKQLADDGRARR